MNFCIYNHPDEGKTNEFRSKADSFHFFLFSINHLMTRFSVSAFHKFSVLFQNVLKFDDVIYRELCHSLWISAVRVIANICRIKLKHLLFFSFNLISFFFLVILEDALCPCDWYESIYSRKFKWVFLLFLYSEIVFLFNNCDFLLHRTNTCMERNFDTKFCIQLWNPIFFLCKFW